MTCRRIVYMRCSGNMGGVIYWAAVLLLGCLLAGWGTGGREAAAQASVQPVVLQGDNLTAAVSYGLEGYIKNGRYTQLTAVIEPKGEKFSGILQVMVPGSSGSDNSDNYAYQKHFSANGKEKTTVSLSFPGILPQDKFLVDIKDDDGRTVCSGAIEADMVSDDQKIFIGVLSEEADALHYLQSTESQVISLQEQDFSEDYKKMDALDVIVITEKDLEFLTDAKQKGLTEWVQSGRRLVLCVETGLEEKLEKFSEQIPEWTAGQSRDVKTSFGLKSKDLETIERMVIKDAEQENAQKVAEFLKRNLQDAVYENWRYEIEDLTANLYLLEPDSEVYQSLIEDYSDEELAEYLKVEPDEAEQKELLDNLTVQKVEKSFTPVSVKNARVLLRQNGDALLQEVEYGMGSIVLSGCSLTLEKSVWQTVGRQIKSVLISDIYPIEQEDSEGSYNIRSALAINETDGLPNLKLYGFLLVLYVLLVGPVFYLICRRKNKRNLLWVLIPGTSVLFSMLIYLLGTGTRIREPYANYVSQLELDNASSGVQKTYFRLVNNSNRSSTTVLEGNCDILPLTEWSYDYSWQADGGEPQIDRIKDKSYQCAIEYDAKQTSITLQNLAAFKGKELQNSQVVQMDGSIQADIISDNLQLKGTVTNGLSCDLTSCFLYNKGKLVLLGDIPAGETITLDKKADMVKTVDYEYDYYSMLDDVLDREEDIASDITRKQRCIYLAQEYLEERSMQGCFLYGFFDTQDAAKDSFIEKLSCPTYGMTAVAMPVALHYRSDSDKMLPDLSVYLESTDYSLTDGKNILKDGVEKIKATYRLPDKYSWKQLIYGLDNNAELSGLEYMYLNKAYFNGSVSLKNQKTGKKISLISSGEEKVVDNLQPYINPDGSLTLYYDLVDVEGDADLYCLPTLMVAVRENTKQEQSGKSSVQK